MLKTTRPAKAVLCALTLSLGACATPPPNPGPDFSVVRFSHDNQDEVLGQKLDGKTTEDGRTFKIPAGSHDLVVIVERRDPNGKMQFCYAKIEYAQFKDGEVYNIHEQRIADKVSLQLRRHQEVLATNTGGLNCSPGS
ncbi:PA0061/PA0062 family lipoprotein [Pseudomonas sp. RIT-To-2]|uniref:PA0061/PA0062 family lipoprotein n=1 Tax=Pseudomonas sp. RIT-To-2 TaxID=3462541 RepID=UPI00241339D9